MGQKYKRNWRKRKRYKYTKSVCYVGVFAALYAVLSAMVKVPFIGHTYLDIGYVVLAMTCAVFNPIECALIGAIGAAAVDIFTNPMGFSISHVVCNIIIGLFLSYLTKETIESYEVHKKWKTIIVHVGWVSTICFLAIFVKSAIECFLYGIPPLVKLPKAIVAYALDWITISVSLPLVFGVHKVAKK